MDCCPSRERVIVTRASNSRAANVETIGAQVTDRGLAPTPTASVTEALEIALNDRSPIIITGSLFTVADAREAWLAWHGQPVEKD